MGSTFEALRRAERERERRRAAGGVEAPAAPASGPFWRRWLEPRPAAEPEEAELASWLVAQSRALAARIDALDEKLDKRFPEAEGRLLRVLESGAAHLERALSEQMRAAVAEEVQARLADAERRAALGRGAIALILLALLLTLVCR